MNHMGSMGSNGNGSGSGGLGMMGMGMGMGIGGRFGGLADIGLYEVDLED